MSDGLMMFRAILMICFYLVEKFGVFVRQPLSCCIPKLSFVQHAEDLADKLIQVCFSLDINMCHFVSHGLVLNMNREEST